MQETTNVNTNNNVNNITNNSNAITLQPIDNYDDINEMLKASEQPVIKQSNFNSNNNQSTNNKSSNQVHLQSLLPDNNKAMVKKAAFKDSVDDIDDMILDFEKKYSNKSEPTTTNNSNINLKNPNPPKIANSNTSIYSAAKTPVQQQKPINHSISNTNATNNNNNNIRDSILAQFKEDPIFGDLLQPSPQLNATKIPNANIQNNNSPGYYNTFLFYNILNVF